MEGRDNDNLKVNAAPEAQKDNSREQEEKKPFPLLLVIVALLGIAVVVGGLFILTSSSKDETDSNTSGKSPTVAVKPSDSVKEEVKLPEYESVGSAKALDEIVKSAQEWGGDVKFVTCSGLVLPHRVGDVQYYIGGNDGTFPLWSCTVYSPSKKQDTEVEWYKGTVEVKEPHTTWGAPGASAYEQDPDSRIFYDPEVFTDTTTLIPLLKEQGVDFSNEYITFAFGFYGAQKIYSSKPVWQVDVYSRNEKDDPTDKYSQGKKLRMIFIDGPSGEVLD